MSDFHAHGLTSLYAFLFGALGLLCLSLSLPVSLALHPTCRTHLFELECACFCFLFILIAYKFNVSTLVSSLPLLFSAFEPVAIPLHA